MKRILLVLLLALPLVAVAQEVKVVSFNVRYNSWNNIDGENGWPNRRSAVGKMILEERPAAIGLQEALPDQINDIVEHTGYRYVGVGRDDGKEAGEFMAICYDPGQLELLSADTRWLSETPDMPSKGWDAACMRTVTIARFRVKDSGREFWYFNTHLDHVGQQARAESTHLLAALVEEFAAADMPVVLGGDMNSTIEDPVFGRLMDCGMQVARDIAPETSHALTYNAFGQGEGSVIDHFFVRNMEVARFRTLDGDYGVPYISDHYPVEITVVL